MKHYIVLVMLLCVTPRYVAASGLPNPNPLAYSGTLYENEVPVSGSRTFILRLRDSNDTSIQPLCETTRAINVTGRTISSRTGRLLLSSNES